MSKKVIWRGEEDKLFNREVKWDTLDERKKLNHEEKMGRYIIINTIYTFFFEDILLSILLVFLFVC